MIPKLGELARSLTTGAAPFAFCGIGVSGHGASRFYTSCASGIAADEDSVFRVASISKIVTAAACEHAAILSGADRPFDLDIGMVLGLDVRHPAHPEIPVTLKMLMTHTSGLTDEGGYSFAGALHDSWDASAVFGAHKPGTYFEYCNLGYILMAAASEVLSGQRFDVLCADVLAQADILGGPNWAGLTHEQMGRFLPTYRRDGAIFVPMIDADHPDPFDPGGEYRLGHHTARFSPQGGMRMPLRSMLELARVRTKVARQPLWHQTDGDGDYLDGLFQHYGIGEQILPDPPFYPNPLIGHFGNAYGFKGGVWWDSAVDLCFAYALNGVEMGDENDALCPAERAIFDAVAQAL